MGSSSKKAKNKEGRKRRHRSRSNSDDSVREKDKERHRHRRHHKERRHDKSLKHNKDYESEGSDIYPSSPQQTRQKDDTSPNQVKSESPTHNQAVESLSIEETNKLRAKLGLKPLEVNSSSTKDSSDSGKSKEEGKIKDDLGEFYHKPAINLAEKADQEKIRAKLNERKDKRLIDSKLAKTKNLGDSDSDEDVGSWIEKNRKVQLEKEQAAKRAKMLEELDEEFGIGDIVESETKLKKAKVYSDRHLKGLKVEHDVKNFSEGKTVILTLKDQDVLAADGDVLINVNMIDNEKFEKNNEFKKKKPVYQPYQDEEFDEDGNFKEKSLLSKYDEEIDGVKKSAFVIGEPIPELKKSLTQSVKEKLSNKRLESLVLPGLNLASEYYTEEEMTKFKKPKKKVKKLRSKSKILTAAELASTVEVENKNDHGSRKRKSDGKLKSENSEENTTKGEFTEWMDIDDLPEMRPIMDGMVKVESEDSNLEKALHKARRLKQREALTTLPPVETLIKVETAEESAAVDPGSIILNSTAEFCRSLGDIPTYGKAGNRDEDEDLMDFERENVSSEVVSSWNPIESNNAGTNDTVTVDSAGTDAPILDVEPDVGSGVGAALRLAMSKGYLDKEENNRPSTSKFAHLQARHYSIEDKTYGDDDKFGGRRERYSGPTLDFKEKDTFKPNVKLEYIDDEGRVLNPKEAFRYLSHKFHGKGPGKNKIEKRIKKAEQEGLMKKMSSTDTPLGTLNMLQHKQKEMQSPYIVLSGSKHTHSTTISKARR